MKKILSVILTLLILSSVSVFVCNADTVSNYLYDNENILNSSQNEVVEDMLSTFNKKYQKDLFLITTNGVSDISEFSGTVYADNSLEGKDCLVYVFDTADSEQYFVPSGVFTQAFDSDVINNCYQSAKVYSDKANYFAMLQQVIYDVTAEYEKTINGNPLTNIVDMNDLINDDDEASLQATIDNIKKNHNFDVVIVTTDTCGKKTITEYADDFYDYNHFGYGDDKSGILFVISMDTRKYWMSTKGYGLTAFTDYGISEIGDIVASYLSDEEYGDGMANFLNDVDLFLTEAETNIPYDTNNTFSEPIGLFGAIIISLVIGLVVAGITVGIMCFMMRNNNKATEASGYIVPGSIKYINKSDVFMYKNVVKTKHESSSSSGGGGSSSHSSSSGSSHGGGGGSF